MSEQKPPKEAPAEEPKPEKKPKAESKSSECPQSPTHEHDFFHNEGTDETYCRYCGKNQ